MSATRLDHNNHDDHDDHDDLPTTSATSSGKRIDSMPKIGRFILKHPFGFVWITTVIFGTIGEYYTAHAINSINHHLHDSTDITMSDIASLATGVVNLVVGFSTLSIYLVRILLDLLDD